MVSTAGKTDKYYFTDVHIGNNVINFANTEELNCLKNQDNTMKEDKNVEKGNFEQGLVPTGSFVSSGQSLLNGGNSNNESVIRENILENVEMCENDDAGEGTSGRLKIASRTTSFEMEWMSDEENRYGRGIDETDMSLSMDDGSVPSRASPEINRAITNYSLPENYSSSDSSEHESNCEDELPTERLPQQRPSVIIGLPTTSKNNPATQISAQEEADFDMFEYGMSPQSETAVDEFFSDDEELPMDDNQLSEYERRLGLNVVQDSIFWPDGDNDNYASPFGGYEPNNEASWNFCRGNPDFEHRQNIFQPCTLSQNAEQSSQGVLGPHITLPKKTVDITQIKGWRKKHFSVGKCLLNSNPAVTEGKPSTSKESELLQNNIENASNSLNKASDDQNKAYAFVCDELDNFLDKEVELKINYEIPHLDAEHSIRLTIEDLASRPQPLSPEDTKRYLPSCSYTTMSEMTFTPFLKAENKPEIDLKPAEIERKRRNSVIQSVPKKPRIEVPKKPRTEDLKKLKTEDAKKPRLEVPKNVRTEVPRKPETEDPNKPEIEVPKKLKIEVPKKSKAEGPKKSRTEDLKEPKAEDPKKNGIEKVKCTLPDSTHKIWSIWKKNNLGKGKSKPKRRGKISKKKQKSPANAVTPCRRSARISRRTSEINNKKVKIENPARSNVTRKRERSTKIKKSEATIVKYNNLNFPGYTLMVRKFGMILHPGPLTQLNPFIRFHLQKIRSYETHIDKHWANFAASAVMVKKQPAKRCRMILPLTCCFKRKNEEGEEVTKRDTSYVKRKSKTAPDNNKKATGVKSKQKAILPATEEPPKVPSKSRLTQEKVTGASSRRRQTRLNRKYLNDYVHDVKNYVSPTPDPQVCKKEEANDSDGRSSICEDEELTSEDEEQTSEDEDDISDTPLVIDVDAEDYYDNEGSDTGSVDMNQDFNRIITKLLPDKLNELKETQVHASSIEKLKSFDVNVLELIKLNIIKQNFLSGYINLWYFKSNETRKSRVFLTFSLDPPADEAVHLKIAQHYSPNELPNIIRDIVVEDNLLDINDFAILFCDGKIWEIYGSVNFTSDRGNVEEKSQVFHLIGHVLPELALLREIRYVDKYSSNVRWWVMHMMQEFTEIIVTRGEEIGTVPRCLIMKTGKNKVASFISFKGINPNRPTGIAVNPRLWPYFLIGPYSKSDHHGLSLRLNRKIVPFEYYPPLDRIESNFLLKRFVSSVIMHSWRNNRQVMGMWLYDRIGTKHSNFIEVRTKCKKTGIPGPIVGPGYSVSKTQDDIYQMKFDFPSNHKQATDKKKNNKPERVYIVPNIPTLGYIKGELHVDNSVTLGHPLNSGKKINCNILSDFLNKIVKRRIAFVPNELDVKWSIVKNAAEIINRKPLNEFSLGGNHALSEIETLEKKYDDLMRARSNAEKQRDLLIRIYIKALETCKLCHRTKNAIKVYLENILKYSRLRKGKYIYKIEGKTVHTLKKVNEFLLRTLDRSSENFSMFPSLPADDESEDSNHASLSRARSYVIELKTQMTRELVLKLGKKLESLNEILENNQSNDKDLRESLKNRLNLMADHLKKLSIDSPSNSPDETGPSRSPSVGEPQIEDLNEPYAEDNLSESETGDNPNEPGAEENVNELSAEVNMNEPVAAENDAETPTANVSANRPQKDKEISEDDENDRLVIVEEQEMQIESRREQEVQQGHERHEEQREQEEDLQGEHKDEEHDDHVEEAEILLNIGKYIRIDVGKKSQDRAAVIKRCFGILDENPGETPECTLFSQSPPTKRSKQRDVNEIVATEKSDSSSHPVPSAGMSQNSSAWPVQSTSMNSTPRPTQLPRKPRQFNPRPGQSSSMGQDLNPRPIPSANMVPNLNPRPLSSSNTVQNPGPRSTHSSALAQNLNVTTTRPNSILQNIVLRRAYPAGTSQTFNPRSVLATNVLGNHNQRPLRLTSILGNHNPRAVRSTGMGQNYGQRSLGLTSILRNQNPRTGHGSQSNCTQTYSFSTRTVQPTSIRHNSSLRPVQPASTARNLNPRTVQSANMTQNPNPRPIASTSTARNLNPRPVQSTSAEENLNPRPVRPTNAEENLNPRPIQSTTAARNLNQRPVQTASTARHLNRPPVRPINAEENLNPRSVLLGSMNRNPDPRTVHATDMTQNQNSRPIPSTSGARTLNPRPVQSVCPPDNPNPMFVHSSSANRDAYKRTVQSTNTTQNLNSRPVQSTSNGQNLNPPPVQTSSATQNSNPRPVQPTTMAEDLTSRLDQPLNVTQLLNLGIINRIEKARDLVEIESRNREEGMVPAGQSSSTSSPSTSSSSNNVVAIAVSPNRTNCYREMLQKSVKVNLSRCDSYPDQQAFDRLDDSIERRQTIKKGKQVLIIKKRKVFIGDGVKKSPKIPKLD